jgi:hypothetical protein
MKNYNNTNTKGKFCFFNFELAEKYGVKEAILLQHFIFWILNNQKKKSKLHFRDNRYWTYLSMHDLQESFPFWTERQIRLILKYLISKKQLIKGEYGRKLYYRANWYTVPDYYLKTEEYILKDNKKVKLREVNDDCLE